jgi:phosphatidylglycerol---prolipoprotein diacylglyceryl transferase
MTSISTLRLKANEMTPAYRSCCSPIGSVGEHRALMHTPASTSARTPSLPLMLDAVVASANRCLILGVRCKPYWIMSDLAALSGLGLALAFSSHLRQVSAFGLCAGILGALLSHKVVLEIKAAVGAVAARSFLQDCLLIIIPIFIAINIAWNQPLDLTIAFLGLLLPLYGGIVRIGCFLGGCCYGEPSQYGVLYPKSIFTLECNGWRRYSPSPDPRQRVFPIQLVESGAQLFLFAVLTFLLWERPEADRYIFPLYLMLYAITRLGLDFYRVTSARPRYGRFSEAQLVCVCVLAAACLYLAYILMN